MTGEPSPSARTTPTAGGVVRGFLDVQRVNLPVTIANTVHAFLRQRGSLGVEAVAFWAGIHDGEAFNVLASIIPEQEARTSERGLAVIVGGDSLFEMNVELHQRGWSVIAQIHSHPGRAYHSETDNAFSVMTRVGGLSIVVPDFGNNALDATIWSVHRLKEDGHWSMVPSSQVRDLIALIV